MMVSVIEEVCPKDHSPLQFKSTDVLTCRFGHDFPVLSGIPVLLRDDIEQTLHVAKASWDSAWRFVNRLDSRIDGDLFLDSLGVDESEKAMAVELARNATRPIDPVVSVIVGATSGHGYRSLIGRLGRYPIPELRLGTGNGRSLLDIGCNWGRWSIAAARKGYRTVGVDPSLGALLAAQRVAKQLGLHIRYVCGDARHLPFRAGSFDTVFSYSVFQHFGKDNAGRAVEEVARVLAQNGNCLIQMAHALGPRSVYHRARRRFSEGTGFEVRYWKLRELSQLFESVFDRHAITVHCFFGLGVERSDWSVVDTMGKATIIASETLRAMTAVVPALKHLADSLYVEASGVRRCPNTATVRPPT
jgi:SAM-dependent methyltransferase/uncharacterized protein YbaR (Trm112 family)